MQDYLYKFTERVIIATRAEETDRTNILNELNGLINEKPEDASEGLGDYLKFLIAIVKGEDTESLFENLDDNIKKLFGDVMQKFKGNGILTHLKELTVKSIAASRGTDEEKETMIGELNTIIEEKPEGGSEGVEKYIKFLLEVVKGGNIDALAGELDSNLLNIFKIEIEETMKSDMMKFFSDITESAFKAAGSENEAGVVKGKITEMISGNSNPPEPIKNYLKLLISVIDGQYKEDLKKGIAPELLEIFDMNFILHN